MSSVFRPLASGRPFIGTATVDGAFALKGIDGETVTVSARQRVVLYAVSADGDAKVGYDTTYLVAVNNQAVSLPWGLPLPLGEAPTTDVGTVTLVSVIGEILD